MLFNSVKFILFFPTVVLCNYLLPKRIRYIWLLIASYYFYMSWNAKYGLLMLFTTAVTYGGALLLERADQKGGPPEKVVRKKKRIAAFSIVLVLLVLGYYKYFNFASEMLEKLFGVIGLNISVPRFSILLPIGISFFTFQSIGYLVDVYRKDVEAEHNFLRYALFVSFFPQLIAGPIERSRNLLGQLSVPHKFNFDMAREGLLLMLWGYFLKIVMADRIAIFVDTVFGSYTQFGGWYLVVANLLMAIQVYCDFYGYSVLARGAAKFLGINLMENFNAPYFSMSIGEFWSRWHISFCTWLRDYVYFPLGGSRKGKARKYVNIIIVFLISGLWHGATSAYVVWGLIFGVYQVVGSLTRPLRDRLALRLHLHKASLGYKIGAITVTFLLQDILCVFVRAGTVANALSIFKSMFALDNPWILFDGSLYNCGLNQKNFSLMMICILILFAADLCKYHGIEIRKVILRQDYLFRWIFIAFAVISILIFGLWGPGFNEQNFIYFQF